MPLAPAAALPPILLPALHRLRRLREHSQEIVGYADLTAVEIVRLLATLDDGELAAIEDFEKAHRNRSMVLNRIRQRRG